MRPLLFMCNAELGVGVGAVKAGLSGRERPFERGARKTGLQLHKLVLLLLALPLPLLLPLACTDQVESTWGSGSLSISPEVPAQ
jgi:hypothetical protein